MVHCSNFKHALKKSGWLGVDSFPTPLISLFFPLTHSFKCLYEVMSIKTMSGLETHVGGVWYICYQKKNMAGGMTDLWTDCLLPGIIQSLLEREKGDQVTDPRCISKSLKS